MSSRGLKKLNREQYYFIQLESEFIYDDTRKIIVTNTKQLKQYIKNIIDMYYSEYFSPRSLKRLKEQAKNDPHRYNDLFSKIKKIYKRLDIIKMQEYTEDHKGYLFRLWYKQDPKSEDTEELISIYAEKIPKKDLYQFANFKRIDQN